MNILLAFFIGFLACFIFCILAIATIYGVIFKHGTPIRNYIEKKLDDLADKTLDKAEIVYPDLVTETFNKEGSTLSDLIK